MPVVLQHGTKTTVDIKIGAIVLAGAPITGKLSDQPVTATHHSDYDETYIITVETDDGSTQQIRASYNHPFFVVFEAEQPRFLTASAHGLDYAGPIEGGAWVDAMELRPGNTLREPDGTLQRIISVDMLDGPLTAHNLTVANAHTYFVGSVDDALWVHNCPEKTFQTYTKEPKDPKKDGVYTGRTSGTKTPLENVANGDRNHHKSETHLPAVLDKTSSNKDAIRGRAQRLLDHHGGAKRQGGTSGNEIREVSETNKKRTDYERADKEEFPDEDDGF